MSNSRGDHENVMDEDDDDSAGIIAEITDSEKKLMSKHV
jgi:hypothetical protein